VEHEEETAACTISRTGRHPPQLQEGSHHPLAADDYDYDHKRNTAFLLYGALYHGMAHEYIFNHLYPMWFGTGTELAVVAA
jgi:hypothetical protein